MEKSAQINTFGPRLREERDRLRLNQTDFGAAGGIKKRAQINYEKGEGAPTPDYWVGITKIGADIQYILTGVRSCNLNHVAEEAAGYQSRGGGSVSQEEKGIIQMYRELRPADRTHARAVIDALACKNLKKDETG